METLFIEAKYIKPIQISDKIAEQLPSSLGLISSIQFVDSLPLIKKSLSKIKKNNVKIITAGQILGCDVKNAEKIKDKVDAFLYIGDGKFHPLGVAIKTKKPVFIFNPINNSFGKIEKKEIENYEKRKKSALIKFLNADVIGVIVSTKPGQYYDINKLDYLIKNKLNKKYPNKKFYVFMGDTIDYNQLNNFPFIEAWVNTACPRIEEDIRIINIEEII